MSLFLGEGGLLDGGGWTGALIGGFRGDGGVAELFDGTIGFAGIFKAGRMRLCRRLSNVVGFAAEESGCPIFLSGDLSRLVGEGSPRGSLLG
jgi:hypothetical protein